MSEHITSAQAKAVMAAAYQAIALNLPLNRFITVHWTRLGLDDAQAANATGRLLKLASDWMATRDAKPAWIWVRENDAGNQLKGSHVHILLHCPAALPIGRMFRRWLRKISGQSYKAGAIKSERIGVTLNACATNAPLYLENLNAVLAYVLKGMHPADAKALSLYYTEPSGRVIGKRVAVSQRLK